MRATALASRWLSRVQRRITAYSHGQLKESEALLITLTLPPF